MSPIVAAPSVCNDAKVREKKNEETHFGFLIPAKFLFMINIRPKTIYFMPFINLAI